MTSQIDINRNTVRRGSAHGPYRGMRLFFGSWLACVMLLWALAPAVWALSDDPTRPWHIVADQMSYDNQTNSYHAQGNVLITKAKTRLSADYVRFEHETMRAFASGNVVLTDGDDVLSGSRIEADLDKGIGTIYDGKAFFKKRHFYLKGEKIDKTGEKTYKARKASITSCDTDSPAWKITARDVNVTLGGYATAKHAAIFARRVPVGYLPYAVIPIKQDRQTGFITPELGYSTRNSFEFNQPFFWAINESSDATVYLDYIEERGFKPGLEYRYVLDNTSKGTLKFDYLDDRRIDDGSEEASRKWGYLHDNFDRTNSDRYWLRTKANQKLGYDFIARLDVDWVSDQDYLFEFKKGYTGYYQSEDYYAENFGRGLDDYDETIRVNTLNFRRTWNAFNLDLTGQWNDNVLARTQDFADTTVQGLPLIDFVGSKQKLLETPFYFDLDSEYAYFYRQDGTDRDNITGMHRADLYPRVYLPLRLKNYLTFEPSAGLRGTYWNVTDVENPDLDEKKSHSRAIYDAAATAFTQFYSIFGVNGKKLDRIKHLIRPEATYTYVPDQDQDDLPAFSDIDRIDKRNQVTYSLTNTLISKKKPLNQGSSPAGDDLYNQFLRFYLEQSYDFNEASDSDIENPEPFSPIYGELELTPWRNLYFKADAQYTTYENELLEQNYELNFTDYRGDYFDVRYRERKDENETLRFLTRLNITRKISGYFDYEYDILQKEQVRLGYGIRYTSQCWAIELSSLEEVDDSTYYFRIHLNGLGGFGQTFNLGQ